MVMVVIPSSSALHPISTPRHYHSFQTILNSFKPLKSYVLKPYTISWNKKNSDSNLRTFSFESNQASSLLATWENSDNGSNSESEEEEEEEEHDMGFESEWEEDEQKEAPVAAQSDMSTTNKYEEKLIKEVEQLLEVEERAILQKNAAPDMKKLSTGKWSSLHTLALSGLVNLMDKQFEAGLDINLIDKNGLTALHTAIIGKKEAVIIHLLRKGASPHVRDQEDATPLHYAVQVGAVRIVKLLIKHKVDVNVADIDGWTPLHIAVQSRNRVIVKMLLLNGADKSRRNKDGRTPIDLGLCYGKDFKSHDLTRLLKILPMD